MLDLVLLDPLCECRSLRIAGRICIQIDYCLPGSLSGMNTIKNDMLGRVRADAILSTSFSTVARATTLVRQRKPCILKPCLLLILLIPSQHFSDVAAQGCCKKHEEMQNIVLAFEISCLSSKLYLLAKN